MAIPPSRHHIQTNADAMRIIVLAGSPFWPAHDAIVSSPVIFADAMGLATGIWTLMGGAYARQRGIMLFVFSRLVF